MGKVRERTGAVDEGYLIFVVVIFEYYGGRVLLKFEKKG